MNSKYFAICTLCLLTLIGFSCSGSKKIIETAGSENKINPSEEVGFQVLFTQELKTNLAYNNSLFGAIFLDADNGEILWETNANKHFIPASNIKILTLYQSLQFLEDSIVTYRYDHRGDTMLIGANGDPSFLHHHALSNQAAFDRMKNHKGPIQLFLGEFEDQSFGSGWAWDDYPYNYQAEKSPFPLYGNTIRFQKKKFSDSLKITPSFFAENIELIIDSSSRTIQREEGNNLWYLNTLKLKGREFDYETPFKVTHVIESLLEDTLKRDIIISPNNPAVSIQEIQYGLPKEDFLQWMMHESDNLYAEQLHLMVSQSLFDTMSVKRSIQYAQDSLLSEVPDSIKWVDGSGLSRYNLMSPRSLAWVLQKISDDLTDDDIQWYFPRIDFIPDQQVFAKTGSLSNNRCLSGYLYTRQNKKIIFSIMVNHYLLPSYKVNESIADLLRVFGEYK